MRLRLATRFDKLFWAFRLGWALLLVWALLLGGALPCLPARAQQPVDGSMPAASAIPVVPAANQPIGLLTAANARTPQPTLAPPQGQAALAPAAAPQPARPPEALQPIPDPISSGSKAAAAEPLKVEVASFNGITPGITSEEEVQKAWGAPKQMTWKGGQKVHLYSVDPFDHIEVVFSGPTVNAIVVRLGTSLPAEPLAEQLNLAAVPPVLVSNDMGEILGQAYPERGVLFSFDSGGEPGKASMQVNQIILEPVSAESFVLRAETYIDSEVSRSKSDLANAVKLDPNNARAHWLQARVLATMGEQAAALDAVDRALKLQSTEPQYQVTRAQILGQMGRFTEGIAQAAAAAALCEKRPHIKARALCLAGDLAGSGASPDYAKALESHTQAVIAADPLAASPHPAVRLAAKEVLIDAHLGAAHDIAWGNWNEKGPAVARWLDKAAAFAEDTVANDGGSEEYRFRVAARALAACVGLEGKADAARWTEAAALSGGKLIAAATDPARRQQLQWDLGMALYDAVQIYQMRGQHDMALRYGEQAVTHLEQGAAGSNGLADLYLLGRLYFRLGAIHAVSQRDHAAACAWFEKAVPALEKSSSQVAPHELPRLGETFVSMGVSYWESQARQKAIELTERGASLVDAAVKQGAAQPAALEVPYNNLATMYRTVGQNDQADKLLRQAADAKNGPVRF